MTPSTARWVATSGPSSGDGAATANSGASDVDNDETDDNTSYASSVAVKGWSLSRRSSKPPLLMMMMPLIVDAAE